MANPLQTPAILDPNNCSPALNRVLNRVRQTNKIMNEDNSFVFSKAHLDQLKDYMSQKGIEYMWFTTGIEGEISTIEMIPFSSAISLAPESNSAESDRLPVEWTFKGDENKYGNLNVQFSSYVDSIREEGKPRHNIKINEREYFDDLDLPFEIDNDKRRGQPGGLGAPAVTNPRIQ